MEVVVIGGGASGIALSIIASKKNHVTLIEKNHVIAKKILATGNGRCNYFNDDFSVSHYRSSDNNLLDKIITVDNKMKVLKFFDNLGIIPKIKDGCYYPYSNKAITVYSSLINEIKRRNIDIISDANIVDLTCHENKFYVRTDKDIIECDKVVISTGSLASTTDKTNFGYEILKEYGHTVNEVLPALVKVEGIGSYFKEWANIRSDVKLSLIENSKIVGHSSGEAMFTDYGISGICTFDLSGRISKGVYQNHDMELSIDFMPYLDENFIEYITKRNELMKDRNLLELFEGMLNYKLVSVILSEYKIDYKRKWENLNLNDKEIVRDAFKNFKMKIKGTKDFKEAQVCTGGIPLDEININTMESKKIDGLYILGELLDVDGDCGGFNLGFAFLSGILGGLDLND